MVGFWKALGSILDGFCGVLGSQVGPKMHRKSIKNRNGTVIEFLIENGGVRCKRVDAGGRVWTLHRVALGAERPPDHEGRGGASGGRRGQDRDF